jgi:hypothetical protein
MHIDIRSKADRKIDAYLIGKEAGLEMGIDAVMEESQKLEQAIEAKLELPFEHPEAILEGMKLALSELQGLIKLV